MVYLMIPLQLSKGTVFDRAADVLGSLTLLSALHGIHHDYFLTHVASSTCGKTAAEVHCMRTQLYLRNHLPDVCCVLLRDELVCSDLS